MNIIHHYLCTCTWRYITFGSGNISMEMSSRKIRRTHSPGLLCMDTHRHVCMAMNNASHNEVGTKWYGNNLNSEPWQPFISFTVSSTNQNPTVTSAPGPEDHWREREPVVGREIINDSWLCRNWFFKCRLFWDLKWLTPADWTEDVGLLS